MEVIKIDDVPKRSDWKNPDLDPVFDQIFVGDVAIQFLVGEDLSQAIDVAQINFSAGAHTKIHTHDTDKIVIVLDGKGIQATDDEEVEIGERTIGFIPAGESHWHGADDGAPMTFISIHLPGKTEIVE